MVTWVTKWLPIPWLPNSYQMVTKQYLLLGSSRGNINGRWNGSRLVEYINKHLNNTLQQLQVNKLSKRAQEKRISNIVTR